MDELRGGLASEGVVFPEEDLMDIYDQLCERYSAVNYEAFLELMVCGCPLGWKDG